MQALRQAVRGEIFDYLLLMEIFKEYKKPRNKVTHLLEKGDIIRIKKGLYVFGEKWRQRPICKEALANLIYGPSYVSLEYALSHYGLIPERVECITSMTTGKTKNFSTPLGEFHYRFLHPSKYSIGFDYLKIDENYSIFIATPEKALADLVANQTDLKTNEDMLQYVTENLRIDPQNFLAFDQKRMKEIGSAYHNQRVKSLLNIIRGPHA